MYRFEKLSRTYKAAALITFNTLILFVVVNVAAWLLRPIFASKSNPVTKTYTFAELSRVYPDLNGAELSRLLDETWSRPLSYESYTHFKESTYQGDFVSVDPAGFRRSKNQGPWPLDTKRFNVFLFGGSTTFGYGVTDGQTIGTYLQEKLSQMLHRDVRVYNFGRSSYQCIQERILFEQLLVAGAVPSLAIFVDGLNDFFFPSGDPYAADLFEKVLSAEWLQQHRYDWVQSIPIVQLATRKSIKEPIPRGSPSGLEVEYSSEQIRTMAETVCARYLRNQAVTTGLAAAYGVEVCFVWQPVPTYKYDLKYHPFQEPNLRYHWLAAHGYRQMAELLKVRPPAKAFLWCADMQDSLQEPLYVDAIHYTGKMSRLLAEQIAQMLVNRKIPH